MQTSPLAPYAAYLRIYDPLSAFPEPERSRWAALASATAVDHREHVLVAEQAAARSRVLSTPPVLVPRQESDEAYVLHSSTGPAICPRQDRLRAWLALSDFRGSIPEFLVDHLVPPALAGEVDLDFARWRADNPSAVPRILTSTWHVPARWFVIVSDSERQLVLTRPGRSLVFRTPMAQARRRAARALRVLQRAMEDEDVVESVEELARWLEEFHPHAWVELDYGGLVELLSDEALESDTSAQDVARAVRALADGDAAAAGEAYGRLVERWSAVVALEHAS